MHIFREILKQSWLFVCRLFPLQRKVIFDNFQRSGMGDDPKYIADALSNDPTIKMVWCYQGKKGIYPSYIKPVRLYSLMYFFHLSTSMVWIDNVRGTFRINKRKGQFYIQTWHATLSLKKVEKEAPTIPLDWKQKSIRDGQLTDLMYTNNDFQKWKYENVYWYSGQVLKCDVPRLSILINPNNNLLISVRQYFNIQSDLKIVLYAPTFRKEEGLDVYRWDYNKVLDALDSRFGGRHIMLIRLHPIIAKASSFINYTDRIINATDYPDMQELLACSDVEINDYSSSMFDFGVLRKPIFLIGKDLNDYMHGDRDLEFRFEDLPFPMATSEDELINNIINFNADEYVNRVNEFYDRIGLVDYGDGANTIANIVREKLSR